MASEVSLWADPLSDNFFVPAVYHTTICVDFKKGGKYWFSYNDNGLNLSPAGKRKPKRTHILGKTDKTLPEATKHAYHLQSTTYATYNALTTNCNHFSNDLSRWLCNELIPLEYIIQSVAVVANPIKLLGCVNSGPDSSGAGSGSGSTRSKFKS